MTGIRNLSRAYREKHVLFVLVDSTRVGHRVCVFDDGDRFTYNEGQGVKVKSIYR